MRKLEVSSEFLKWFALLTMTMDHIDYIYAKSGRDYYGKYKQITNEAIRPKFWYVNALFLGAGGHGYAIFFLEPHLFFYTYSFDFPF